MFFLTVLQVVVFLASRAACVSPPPIPTTTHPTTTTSSTSMTTQTPVCCGLVAQGVSIIVWYNSSVEVTVATVSTNVYQYDNTAITNYTTYTATSTPSLPNGIFGTNVTISGVPTTLVDPAGPYQATSTIIHGTEFTDPRGVVFASPTPVLYFQAIQYFTNSPTLTGSSYACPTFPDAQNPRVLDIEPSGFYAADTDVVVTSSRDDGEFIFPLPTTVTKYMIDNPPNVTATPEWLNVPYCTPDIGNGAPFAHIPVASVTANSAPVTFKIVGVFGVNPQPTITPTAQPSVPIVVPPIATPVPTPGPTQPGATAPVLATPAPGAPVVVSPGQPGTFSILPDGRIISVLPDGQLTTLPPSPVIPTLVPAPVVSTLPDGKLTTLAPAPVVSTLPGGGLTTLAPAPVVSTLPNGELTTLTPNPAASQGASETNLAASGTVTVLPDGTTSTIGGFGDGSSTTAAPGQYTGAATASIGSVTDGWMITLRLGSLFLVELVWNLW